MKYFIVVLLYANVATAKAIQEGIIKKLFVSNDTKGKVDSQRVIVRLVSDIKGGLCEKNYIGRCCSVTQQKKLNLTCY